MLNQYIMVIHYRIVHMYLSMELGTRIQVLVRNVCWRICCCLRCICVGSATKRSSRERYFYVRISTYLIWELTIGLPLMMIITHTFLTALYGSSLKEVRWLLSLKYSIKFILILTINLNNKEANCHLSLLLNNHQVRKGNKVKKWFRMKTMILMALKKS